MLDNLAKQPDQAAFSEIFLKQDKEAFSVYFKKRAFLGTVTKKNMMAKHV